MRCNQELFGHINCDRDVILGEKYCKFHFVPSLRIEIEKLRVENIKLKECLEFTTYAAEYLFKPDENLAEGLFPTSYFTLSYEGDLELIEKTKRARQVLKELDEEL